MGNALDLVKETKRLSDGLTLPRVILRNAEEYGSSPALTMGETTITWGQLRELAAAAARGLGELGLGRADRMMIMMSSRPEHWQADLGAAHLGALPCTVYRTSSPEQVAFMARHSGATIAVLEGATDVAAWHPALDTLPSLKRVVVLDESAIPTTNGQRDPRYLPWSELIASGRALHAKDPSVFEQAWQAVKAEDPVALLYTSGTTGDPKGVVLSHTNVFWGSAAGNLQVPTPMQDPTIAYLPLAHIAERMLGIYRAAYKASHVTICPDPALLVPALAKVRPPAFFGVPRVWEKLAAGLRAIVGSLGAAEQAAMLEAHGVASEKYRLEASGKPVPQELEERVAAVEETMLRPLRARLGLDNLTWSSSGAAPIPVDVLEYLGGFNLKILEVWGLSESTGAATMSLPDSFRVGAVGRPVPGVEVKLADDGEILIRGPILLQGYLGEGGKVVKATDADGWFATGDVGTLDGDGFLTITDRKKELIITSMGKNIAPSPIEGLLRAHPLVGHAIVIGDRRPYLVALIALDPDSAPAWAKAHGLAGASLAALAESKEVRAELDTLVASVNARVSRPEQVKRYRVVPDAWLPGTTLVTPTLKLRRRGVVDQYGGQIIAMYEEDERKS